MRRLFLLFTAACVGVASQAQLSQVVVEEFEPICNAGWAAFAADEGLTTYRIYAETVNSNDKVIEMTAQQNYDQATQTLDTCLTLYFNSTTSIYNSTLGASLGAAINPIFCGFFPELAGDSWLTIGAENESQGAVQTIGLPMTGSFNTVDGVDFFGVDGSVFALPTDPNVLPVGPDNRVLLAQITTSGELSFGINLNVWTEGDPQNGAIYTHGTCSIAANEGLLNYISAPEIGLLYPQPVADVEGCTDEDACNFDPLATLDDDSCFSPGDECDDEDPTTVNDTVQPDCTCLGVQLFGCTDDTACNFDPIATVDDDTCIFPGDACDDVDPTTVDDTIQPDCSCAGVQVPGCTDLAACNYDANATVDDASCLFVGDSCDDGDPLTFGDAITAACGCEGTALVDCFDPGCDADTNSSEYLTVLTDDPFCCETEWDIFCQDAYDAIGGQPNPAPECDVLGCTDPLACNFDPAANTDDGSCLSNDCNGDCGGTAVVDGCGDCVGGNTGETAGTPGCTDPLATNFDAGATCDDGSCVFGTLNDVPALATALSVNFIGNCSSVSGDVDQAEIIAPQATATATAGLWYEFNAVTSGVRIQVQTSDFDAVVELQDAAHNVIDIEDAVFGNGNEILNFGGLTAGDQYFVRVAPASATGGAAIFDICVEWLPESQCDFDGGTYSLCQLFKAKWVPQGGSNFNVVNYIFNFTQAGTMNTSVFETNAAFTWANLSAVDGILWDESYEVAIDIDMEMTNGAGETEVVTVEGSNECAFNTAAVPVANLRPQDNLTNAGPLFLGAYIWAVPWACTATGWTWEFVNDDGSQLPIEYYKDGPGRQVRLLDVPGLEMGAVYNVRVKPEFPTGISTDYAAVDQIAIVGTVGMPTEIESPVVADNQADRSLDMDESNFALYPNPNNGEYVNINLSNVPDHVERITVDIYDTFGKLVISRQIANAASQFNMIMPLDGIASGVYTVSIIIDGEVRTERMIVQR